MRSIRSIIWIGRGEHFAADLVADAPALDVVWERDVKGALALPLDEYDALVLDAEGVDEALGALGELGRKRALPPLLVRLDAEDAGHLPDLLAAGAGDVLLRGSGRATDAAALLEHLEKLACSAELAPHPGARRPRSGPPCLGIVGDSPEMREILRLAERASRSAVTVLLTGETGTGKELIARAVHRQSSRASHAFVAVNCAAFPDALLESELFGHIKGSFTSADRDRKGLFEVADRGTLFLDEVSETSGPFQAKLLRVLQEREVRPVGGTRARRTDVRVVAASNRDLWREVLENRFREDLYYRLAVFPIHVPPLRDRSGDVLPLAEHFLALHDRTEKRRQNRLSQDAARLLQAYRWPGNVRELDNEIQRALALAEPGEALTPAHFSQRLLGILEPIEANAAPGETLRETLGRIEAWLIRRALDANGGRRAQTARRLGITREGLYKKMQRYGIR